MSDFIFSSVNPNPGVLGEKIRSIYHENPPDVLEFHGLWGAVAVSRNLHIGFDPVETETHICIVIGGPILNFVSNSFLGGSDCNFATGVLLDKWLSAEGVCWNQDLAGPFVAIKIDKIHFRLEIITDIISYIPVYICGEGKNLVLGTHVDMVARAGNCDQNRDPISMADFVLHGVITFPFTLYPEVKQIMPASRHSWCLKNASGYKSESYWLPIENNCYRSMSEAADRLRSGLKSYVNAVTEGLDRVAILLSGGEDSRVVAGLIPEHCQRDAFIFVDQFNREGKAAQAAARAYRARFTMCFRRPFRDLQVLPACSDLVGSGSEYLHVHGYGFPELEEIRGYRAVFGGFFSNTLLKGCFVRTLDISRKYPFLPAIRGNQEFPDQNANSLGWPYPSAQFPDMNYGFLLGKEVLEELKQRRFSHLERIRTFRDRNTVREWFHRWPASMHADMANLQGNRRLFASYEPFMTNVSVEVSAAVPQSWTINRRLFLKMARPFLEPTKNLLHSNGWLPYYPWYVNVFVHGALYSFLRLKEKFGIKEGNQGAWSDWNAITQSEAWSSAISNVTNNERFPEGVFSISVKEMFECDVVDLQQKINLMQILYQSHDEKISHLVPET